MQPYALLLDTKQEICGRKINMPRHKNEQGGDCCFVSETVCVAQSHWISAQHYSCDGVSTSNMWLGYFACYFWPCVAGTLAVRQREVARYCTVYLNTGAAFLNNNRRQINHPPQRSLSQHTENTCRRCEKTPKIVLKCICSWVKYEKEAQVSVVKSGIQLCNMKNESCAVILLCDIP